MNRIRLPDGTGPWHGLRFVGGMKCFEALNRTVSATRIDMRNSMDFLCMLKTCALIKRLAPGEGAHILANDTNFPADLRRVRPDCTFEIVPCAMGFEENADYLVRVARTVPKAENR